MFAINRTITVPSSIADSGTARIVGKEWGPDNNRKRSDGWLYHLSLGNGPAWLASEEEILQWGNI